MNISNESCSPFSWFVSNKYWCILHFIMFTFHNAFTIVCIMKTWNQSYYLQCNFYFRFWHVLLNVSSQKLWKHASSVHDIHHLICMLSNFLNCVNFMFEIEKYTALIQRFPKPKVGIWANTQTHTYTHTLREVIWSSESVWYSINHFISTDSYIFSKDQPYTCARKISLTSCCEGEKWFIWYLFRICTSQLGKQLKFDLSDCGIFLFSQAYNIQTSGTCQKALPLAIWPGPLSDT